MTHAMSVRSQPDISVVMSCYNASRWLKGAIDSILAQTFRNYEFILIDDGSTDRTRDIIADYSKIDKRIIVISKDNTGLADSLNLGITKTRGTWIARLDADDLAEPSRLEQQLYYLHNHSDVVLLGSGCIEIDENGRGIKKYRYPSYHNKLIHNLTSLKKCFPHSSVIFKRNSFLNVRGYNPVFRKAQDMDLWLRLSEQGRIASSKKILVRIRKHSKQISNSSIGVSQLVYGYAAAVCYYVKKSQYPSSLNTRDGNNWETYLSWINMRMKEEGIFERQKIWSDARAVYYETTNRNTAILALAPSLLRPSFAGAMVLEKIFGSSLPKRLALEWITR